MAEYRVSSSLYKRIQERKNRIIRCLGACVVAQTMIIIISAFSGRDGIIIGCALESLLVYLIFRYLRHDIRSITYRNRVGKVMFCDVDKYIDRRVSNGGRRGRGVRYNYRTKANYTLYISVDDKIITVSIPDRDAYLSYKKDDEVMLMSYLPYPVITSRTPKSAVCPQCASLLHYEDGACHNCGLEDIYPNFCTTPKWERK